MATTVFSKPGYDMGPHTHWVPMELFAENRRRLCERLRRRDEVPPGAVVLLQGGDSLNSYDSDCIYNFRQESFFTWTFGVQEPGFYGAVHVDSGAAALFMPRLPPDYSVWMGKITTPAQVRSKFAVDDVYYVDEIAYILESIYEWCPTMLLLLHGLNTDSNLFVQAAKFKGIENFNVDTHILHPEISECRVIKSSMELDVMRYVNKIASEAHTQVLRKVRPGMKEYQSEAVFLQYCYYVGGCRQSAYTCICGSGKNTAVLHYGHAGAANSKTILDGDMCLFDMGCSYCGYASDITCSFPANGKFTEDQKMIYNAVLKASHAVIRAIAPGVSWVDMHILATHVLLEQLCSIGLLRGNVDDMLQADLAAIFMPHGLGHFLGLDVHDVGGYLPGTPRRPLVPGLNKLRTSRVLQPGMVLTLEPGCYFIDSLLESARYNQQQNQYLVPEVLMRFKDFGGVRIEDNVVVTETGTEILTVVPRFIEDIEDLMKSGSATLDEICACTAD